MPKNKKIAVVGLGYVGLPLALAFADKYQVVGYDINAHRIAELNQKQDGNKELVQENFINKKISFSTNLDDIAECNFFIIAVPTPVDVHKVPELEMLKAATKAVGSVLKRGDYVIFESTVYPGCTEEVCVPLLVQESELEYKKDFKVAYSPERINPGDTKNTIDKIIKIVSACDDVALSVVSEFYSDIITAGLHKASSMKIAEAAKIIENTQRDVNIAFMNEIAIIFDKLDINTHEVLAAAGTKWNFMNFYPGLVGGHCIGIDPYYLTYKAKQVGYEPEVVLSGRRVNNNIAPFIAQKIVKNLLQQNKKLSECSALIRGITYKENVPDTRNSKVLDLIKELKEYQIQVDVQDPLVDKNEVVARHGVEIIDQPSSLYDVVVIAVSHKVMKKDSLQAYMPMLKEEAIVFDVKSTFAKSDKPEGIVYLSL